MPMIYFSKSLQKYTKNTSSCSIKITSVDQLAGTMLRMFPSTEGVIFSENKNLMPFVSLFYNDEHVKRLNDMSISEGDSVRFIMAVAGG